MRSVKTFAVLAAVLVSLAVDLDACGLISRSRSRNIERVGVRRLSSVQIKPSPRRIVGRDQRGIHPHVLSAQPPGDARPSARDVSTIGSFGVVAQTAEEKSVTASVQELKGVNWHNVRARVLKTAQSSYVWHGLRNVADASSPDDVANAVVLEFWRRYVAAPPEYRKIFYWNPAIPLDEAVSKYLASIAWYRPIDHSRRDGRAELLDDERAPSKLSDRNRVKNHLEFNVFTQQVSKHLEDARMRAVVRAIAEGAVTNIAIAEKTNMTVDEVENLLKKMRRRGQHLGSPTTKPANGKARTDKLHSSLFEPNVLPIAA